MDDTNDQSLTKPVRSDGLPTGLAPSDLSDFGRECPYTHIHLYLQYNFLDVLKTA